MLEAAGFNAYEVSNHARGEAARSRHNLIYWRGGDYLGVGPGAHGRLTTPDSARWSTLTPSRIADYIARVETTGHGVAERVRLSPIEAAQERLLMGLRTDEGVALDELAALHLDPEMIRSTCAGTGCCEADRRPGGPDRHPATAAALLDRITLELARKRARTPAAASG